MSGMEITLRDVYEQQLHTGEQVARLRGEVGALTARVDERLDNGQRKMDDHEKRIRALEKLAWKLIGAFAAVNAVAVLAEWLLWARP